MPTNAARGDFVFDYVVASPRRRRPGIRIAMAAMIVVLLAASAASLHLRGAVDEPGAEPSDVLTQGP